MKNIFLVIPLEKKDKGIKQLVIKFSTWYFLSLLCKKKKKKSTDLKAMYYQDSDITVKI